MRRTNGSRAFNPAVPSPPGRPVQVVATLRRRNARSRARHQDSHTRIWWALGSASALLCPLSDRSCYADRDLTYEAWPSADHDDGRYASSVGLSPTLWSAARRRTPLALPTIAHPFVAVQRASCRFVP